jgi:hypothetical protein
VLKMNYQMKICLLRQLFSTWDSRTPGGTVRHLRGYTKTFYSIREIEKKKYIIS